MTEDQQKLAELIHRSGRLLDDQSFGDYATLFAETGQYRLMATSPEVREPMTWILLNRDELGALLTSASKHVWNTGQRNHLITIEEIHVDGEAASTTSGFCVFHTDDDGATRVYAVGRYEDLWQRYSADWKLLRRIARLRTRALAPPSAIPL